MIQTVFLFYQCLILCRLTHKLKKMRRTKKYLLIYLKTTDCRKFLATDYDNDDDDIDDADAKSTLNILKIIIENSKIMTYP